jgi:hypothetical protein
MKNQYDSRLFRLTFIGYLITAILLVFGGIAFSADEGAFKKGDMTTDGLTVTKSTSFTQTEIKKGVTWSDYTKYRITPVEVSFRKNWQKDYNQGQTSLSQQVTEKDMAGIRESIGKIAYEELDKVLQKRGHLTKADMDDSKTLLFKPKVINLDIYAPDVQSSEPGTMNYVRQAGKATLFLEVYDSVSGEILGRWIDTREDPDRGYFDWANMVTNNERMRLVISAWAGRLVEGFGKLEAEK